MSDKSGVAEQVVTTPSGGGALTGMGETFSPDLHTGTGNFTVPIELPTGRNEFQPDLALTYSTGNGNGPFGLGWALSVPGVGRKTADGIPVYDETEDTFILSGTEDLVPIAELAGDEDSERRVRYRPRTEGLFARIDHHQSPTSDYWNIWSKDGLHSTYGTPAARGVDPATVAKPSNREKIFEWRLTETVDPFDNRVTYEYLRDTGNEEPSIDSPDGGPQQWDQLYLRRIRYIDFDRDDETKFLISVTFEYEDREDPFSERRAGFEIRTRLRCKRILIRTHADVDGTYIEDGRLVRSYELRYADEREEVAARLPLNGTSVLSQIRVTGHDGDQTQELPPLEFGYTQFDPDDRNFLPLEGDLSPLSLSSPDLELADLFGNGLPDFVQISGTVRYWRNLGDGVFDEPRTMRETPTGVHLSDQGVQLIDADGDGRTDLLATANGLSGYFPLGHTGEWDRRSFQAYEMAPSFNLEDAEVQLVDLDGDGVTDAIRSGSRFECFFNDPEEGWHRTRRIARRQLDEFPNISFDDPRVRWGDMSGDGLQDIVLIHDGNVEYWPHLGHGDWDGRIHMRNSPRFPSGYDPTQVLVGDIDGDGLADLVFVEDNHTSVWLNQSGHRWSDRIEIEGTPSVTDMDAIRLVDLLGTGVKGVLWSGENSGGGNHAFFLDFTGGTKPYVLDEMDNHLGAITRVEYASSTELYLKDENQPETRWKTSLPFPVQVVSRVESIDAISEGKLTTVFRYHHGYWDGAEREFRGFGMVEQLDSETFDEHNTPGLHGEERRFLGAGTSDPEQFSSPTLTKTWFHQGPIGNEFGDWEEPDYGHEYWPNDPGVLSRPEAMQEMIGQLPRRARRDALRTLRGRVLRTELYALDDSEREDRPYTVTEQLHGVREEDPSDDPDRRRIFFPHSLATRVTQWERGDDPMTQYSFTDGYDEFGQSRYSVEISEPRTPAFHHLDEPNPYLGTYTLTEFGAVTDDDQYLVDRTVRSTTYEIREEDAESVLEVRDSLLPELHAALDGGPLPEGDPVSQTVTFYDGAAFTGLPFGELGEFGAAVRTETLVLTDAILADAYPVGDAVLGGEELPYFAPDGTPAWPDGAVRPDPYPEAFKEWYGHRRDETRATVAFPPADQLTGTPLGYGFSDGRADAPFAGGYYVATDRRAYDFQLPDVDGSRGLLRETLGPLGFEHDGTVENRTRIEYDVFEFLPVAVTDPVGLTTRVDEYDYRTFQPARIVDPNENQTAFGYTPIGLLRYTAVLGRDGVDEGDTRSQPGTIFQYGLEAVDEGPGEDRRPVYVHTATRKRHQQPPLSPQELDDLTFEDEIERHPDQFIQTREYSDGFGRLIQTRSQAEDVIVGDSTFGNADLFVDQVIVIREDEEFDPADLEDLSGRSVGVRTGTSSEQVAIERLLAPGILNEAELRHYPNYPAAIDALVAEDIDAVVLDESIATTFASERPVRTTLPLTPKAVVGEEISADENPRVTVSGWQTFDNKGQVVEQFEPFFDTGWEYLSSEKAEMEQPAVFGQKSTTYYDPRGQVVRTVSPNGSERRVLFGALEEDQLNSPDEFVPTPWEKFTYDANDNADRTHRDEPDRGIDPHIHPPERYESHWNTPGSGVLDGLGRTINAVERNRTDTEQPVEELRTRTSYDIRGNVLTMTDAEGREAFSYSYDLADSPLRTESIDAGTRVTVYDAAGNEIERRDGRGVVSDVPDGNGVNGLVLQAYDELDRPARLWARDGGVDADETESPTLREYLIYGDGPEAGFRTGDGTFSEDAVERNLLEMLVSQYDEAGLLTIHEYDFKGNLLEKERRVITDEAIPEELPVDWQPPETTLEDREAVLLDESRYATSLSYDALNRVVSMRYPEDAAGERKELRSTYNSAGALKHVDLVSSSGAPDKSVETFVEHIAYNAKGQRTLLALGNGVMARFAYDPQTFRLSHLRSERYDRPLEPSCAFVPEGAPLQDFRYEYDLAGNVLTLRNRTPDSGIIDSPLGRHAFDRTFEYDALYQLVSASGRECGSAIDRQPWDGAPRCTDLNGTRAYAETYEYNSTRCITRLGHSGEQGRNGGNQFVRRFSSERSSNRLETMTVGGAEHSYHYDGNGNLLRENAHRNFEWDHSDRLKSFRTQVDDEEARTHYRYDAGGQRISKVVRSQSGKTDTTVYLNGLFEHHRWQQNGTVGGENTRIHVMDDLRRIAMIRVGDVHPHDEGPAVQYHLHDHVGSSNLVIDAEGSVIEREEYTPYGETVFGSFAKKRYRFAGNERDEESGLYYQGARYYAPWIARWTGCDPAGPVDETNLYTYTKNNPLVYSDPSGLQSKEIDCHCNTSHHRSSDEVKPVNPERLSESFALMRQISSENLPITAYWSLTRENLQSTLQRGLPSEAELTQFESGLLKGERIDNWDLFRVVPTESGEIGSYVLRRTGSVTTTIHFSRSGEILDSTVSENGLEPPDLLPSLGLGLLTGSAANRVIRGAARLRIPMTSASPRSTTSRTLRTPGSTQVRRRSKKPLADLKREAATEYPTPYGDRSRYPRHMRGWFKNEQRRTGSKSPYKWRNPPGYVGRHPLGKPFRTHGDRGGKLNWGTKELNDLDDAVERGHKVRTKPRLP